LPTDIPQPKRLEGALIIRNVVYTVSDIPSWWRRTDGFADVEDATLTDCKTLLDNNDIWAEA
jgi:hypothetical protein